MRLFVAVWPSPEVVAALRALPRPAVPGLRWTTEHQWHVTLRFLGEADAGAAGAALRRLVWPDRPEAVVGPRVGRFGGSVVHLPVAGLDGLAGAVASVTGELGERSPARPFRGHLTLGRVNRGRADVRAAARALGALPVGGRWTVEQVTLVASTLHPEGARYEVVAAVPLPAPGAPSSGALPPPR